MSGVLLMMAAGSGSAPGTVSIGNETISNGAGDASIIYNNDGTTGGLGTGHSGNPWVTPQLAGVAAQYEVRASGATGDTAQGTGSFDTWLVLSSNRTFGLNAGGFGLSFTVEIRDKFTQIVRDTATVVLNT